MVLNVLNQYSRGRIRTIKNPDFLLRSLEYIWMYISQFTFKTQQVEKGGGAWWCSEHSVFHPQHLFLFFLHVSYFYIYIYGLSYMMSHIISTVTPGILVIPILQMRKQRPREVKWLVEGLSAPQWKSKDLNQVLHTTVSVLPMITQLASPYWVCFIHQ